VDSELLSTDHANLLDAVTDAKIRAISWDLEIGLDNLKYITWIGTIATAGIGFLITNFEKVTPKYSPISQLGIFLPISSALILMASIIIAGYSHWLLNQQFELKRLRMTLALKQKCLILSGDSAITQFGNDEIFERLTAMAYTSEENREHIAEIAKKVRDEFDIDILLLLQSGLVALGVLVAFLGAIR
jgi:hypothetical protein